MEAGLPLALEPGAPTAAGPAVASPPRSCHPGHTHLGERGPASGQRPGTRPFLRLPHCPAPGLLAVSLLCLPAWGHRVQLRPPPSAHQPMSLRGLRSLGLLPWIRGCLLLFSLALMALKEAQSTTGCRHRVRRGREGNFMLKSSVSHPFTHRGETRAYTKGSLLRVNTEVGPLTRSVAPHVNQAAPSQV